MVQKNTGVVKDHTFRFVPDFVVNFVPWANDKHRVLSPLRAKHLIGKHIKIFNYHFSLEAWLAGNWKKIPNFQEVSYDISFCFSQCLGQLNIRVQYDFCCCVVNPSVCCYHFIPEQITHVNGFNQQITYKESSYKLEWI